MPAPENFSLNTYVIGDEILKGMVVELNAYLASEKLDEIRYPKDWWQAFKERWLPKWLKKYYPVEYKVFEARAFYPNVSIPEYKPYIRIRIVEPTEVPRRGSGY